MLVPPTPFGEDAAGNQTLRTLLGGPEDLLIAMEATVSFRMGHYWQDLFAVLAAEGFAVALLNPMRTRRFAGEDLAGAKTDSIDAVGIARFAAQKRPAVTRLPEAATQELRELVRLRDRLRQEFGDRTRHLHRLVDLGFPEFTRYVPDLKGRLATGLLAAYPTARALAGVSVVRLAALRYDGVHRVGADLARALLAAAQESVGQRHGPAYQLQVRYLCEDLELLRGRIAALERDIATTLRTHEVGTLLTTITGIGVQTAARLVAELDAPAAFRTAAALATYIGVVPGTRESGKRRLAYARLPPTGHARLRAALSMLTLVAVRTNPWLRAYHERLRARGKVPKVALIAALHKLLFAVYSVAKHRCPFVPHLTVQGGQA